jgi:hypothetical protein
LKSEAEREQIVLAANGPVAGEAGQQEINGNAVLVDRPIEIAPFATDFHVGFVDTDRAAMRTPKLSQALLNLGRVGEHPAVDGAVIDIEAALGEQALDIAAA